MRPSPERLANALASRLNAVLPASLSAEPIGYVLAVYAQGRDQGWSAAASIVADPDDRTDAERVETAIRAILTGVQDSVSEYLTAQWPAVSDGGMALPECRAVGDCFHLWYGDESAPVIVFPPVHIRELAIPD